MKRFPTDYHDYVFKEGKLVGDFEGMYRHSSEIPWHQDKTAYSVSAEIDLAILRSRRFKTILDVGAGLGYFTARLARELVRPDGGPPSVTGLEISQIAVEKAAALFPEISFLQADLLEPKGAVLPSCDLVIVKDVMWYVCHRIEEFLTRVRSLMVDGGYVLVSQSFPEEDRWIGQEVLGCPDDLRHYVSTIAEIEYWCEERDPDLNSRPYVHILAKKLRDGSESDR